VLPRIAQVFGRVFFAALAGNGTVMGTWGLLTIPGTLVLIALLLMLSNWAEHKVVSSRALIVRVATRRRTPPERGIRVVPATSRRGGPR
jgi:hypothetical protein